MRTTQTVQTHAAHAADGARPRGTRRGFTLVELLVVIGIIALLVSILLPTLSSARSSAQLVTCQSNVRQTLTATLMYCDDNEGVIPWGRMPGARPDSQFAHRILQYLVGEEDDPANPAYLPNDNFRDVKQNVPVLQCPSAGEIHGNPPWYMKVSDYSKNAFMSGTYDSTPPLNRETRPVKISRVKDSAEKYAISDGTPWPIKADAKWVIGRHDGPKAVYTAGWQPDRPDPPFEGKVSVSFWDGHGVVLLKKEMPLWAPAALGGPTEAWDLGGNPNKGLIPWVPYE